MKKYLFLIIVLLTPFKIYAHEQLSDGWHVVKAIEKTDNCKLNYVWAYYKNGVEQSRFCRLIQVHRAWGEAPENSLAGIKMVKAKGYNTYEIDIRFTKDNVAVLSHDATINRIARNKDFSEIKEKITIKDHTLSELNNYIFVTTRGGKVLKNYSNNKITTFEEALKYSKENGLFITIELKGDTDSQITSLVKMVKDKKMDNSVKYTSFQATLLKYVKDVDSYADLTLFDTSHYTSTGICQPTNDRYCKSVTEKGKDEGIEQREKFHKMLDTGHNYLRLSGDKSADSQGQGSLASANLPEDIEKYPMNKNKITKLIQKPSLTISKSEVSIKTSKTKSITYTYNGDGNIKCVSEDKKYVTCTVDKTKKTIKVNVIKELAKNITIKVYATQGVKYSATSDVTLTILRYKSTDSSIKGDVNGDGKVTSTDYIVVRKHILKQTTLTGDKFTKADITGDKKITSLDYIAIRKIILNNS